MIEKVSGTSWSEFMPQTIFGPAGMTDSGRMTNRFLPPRRARGYIRSAPRADVDFDAYFLAYSTLEDVYRYDTALLAGSRAWQRRPRPFKLSVRDRHQMHVETATGSGRDQTLVRPEGQWRLRAPGAGSKMPGRCVQGLERRSKRCLSDDQPCSS